LNDSEILMRKVGLMETQENHRKGLE
jgi:hypothetical protein